MNKSRLVEVIEGIGKLGIEKRQIVAKRDALKAELKSIIEEHRDELLEINTCEACKGSGKTLTGKKCMSCMGQRVRFTFVIDVHEDFSCKLYDINQFAGIPSKAREKLDHNTFRSLFKLTTHEKIDVRLNTEGQAKALSNG